MKTTSKPKVNFSYDLKKDAWSWVVIAKSKDLWGMDWREQVAHIPDDLLNKIRKNNFTQAQKIVEKHIKENPRTKYKSLIVREEKQEKWKRLIFSSKNANINVLAMHNKKPMTIDSHVHISIYKNNTSSLEGALDLLLEEMEKNEIGAAIFGTDWPMCKIEDHIELVKSLGLSKGVEEKIFYKNSANIYNLLK